MRARALVIVFFFAVAMFLAVAVRGQDIIVGERQWAGISFELQQAWVNRYTFSLGFIEEVTTYRLTAGSPRAVLAVGDTLYVGEGGCTWGGTCSPRVVAHYANGTTAPVGPLLRWAPVAIRHTPRSELLVVAPTEVLRIGPATGMTLARFDLPAGEYASDGDADASGCKVAIALDYRVVVGHVCGGDDPGWSELVHGAIRGVRFAANGDLFIATRLLQRVDANGTFLRTWTPPATDPCAMALDEAGGYAILGCGPLLMRLDLATGVTVFEHRSRNADYITGITIVHDSPAHPRTARH